MTVDARPSWGTPAPYPALKVFITALEYAAHGDADQATITLVDADKSVHPAWFRIQGADALAAACQGPDASAGWAKLREECHLLAVESGAPDAQLRASLAVIALSEARERGQGLRVGELTSIYVEEFGDAVLGCVGVQLAGYVLAAQYGDELGAMFVRMKRHFGIIGGAA